MNDYNRFAGKVCIVTGGGSGIGLATATRFAKEGAHVIIADYNEEHGQKAASEIGERAVFVKCNVGESKDVQNVIAEAVKRWKKIDVVVNDAAVMTFDPIIDLKEEDWYRVMHVNLGSCFLFAKYATPHMQKGGCFVNISSVHAFETTVNVVPYATSKGGMEAFTRGLALELEAKKIRVNAIAPGAVDTPMLWSNPNVKSGKEKIEGAIGKPDDIAAAICFIASAEARYINGTTIVVDGARLDIL